MFEQLLANKNKITTVKTVIRLAPLWPSKHGLALHAVDPKRRRSAHVHACMLPVAYTYMHFFAIAKLRAVASKYIYTLTPGLVPQFSSKFYYAKRRFPVTSKCRQMH
jgi:hypothetical protein